MTWPLEQSQGARVMYPICPESRGLLDELDHLRSAARALLGLASPAACEEWTKFERRLPSALELLRGAISLSRSELREMGSKARRFRDILEASRGGSPGDGVSRALIGRP